MTQSVVVYRNPFEQWMWESGFMSWVAFVLLVMILAVILYVGIESMLYRMTKLSYCKRHTITTILFFVMIVVLSKTLSPIILG